MEILRFARDDGRGCLHTFVGRGLRPFARFAGYEVRARDPRRQAKFYNAVGASTGREVKVAGRERTIVARQDFDRSGNSFELDLHGCSMEEGRSAAGQRIRECSRYDSARQRHEPYYPLRSGGRNRLKAKG